MISPRDKIDQRVADYLNDQQIFEIFNGPMAILDTLEQNNENVFLKGKTDLWAAASIYAFARENSLNYKDTVVSITLDHIAEYYKLNKSSLSNKTGKIIDQLEMNLFSPRFPIRKYFSLEHLEDDQEEEQRGIVAFILHLEIPFSDFEKELQQLMLEANDDLYEEDYAQILEQKVNGSKIAFRIEGQQLELDFILEELEQFGTISDNEYIDTPDNPYAPNRHYAMFMEQHTAMNLEATQYEKIDDIHKLISSFRDKSIEEIKKMRPATAIQNAEIEAIKAYKLEKEKSIKKVKQILEKFPNTVEAYICLAGWEKNPEKKIDLLQDALEAGNNKLDIAQIDKDKGWWKDHNTRPYMRAMNILGGEFVAEGYLEDAIELFEEMLIMNENDNQGIRYILAEILIDHNKWKKLKLLLDNHKDEGSLIFSYAKVLYHYFSDRHKGKAKYFLEKAFDQNEYVLPILMGDIETYEFSHYAIGSPEEAMLVYGILSNSINTNKKFTQWLIETHINWKLKEKGTEKDAKIISLKK